MSYAFPPDLEQLVNLQLTSGNYHSEDDVLRAALRALQDRQSDLAAITAGYADLEAGRVRPFEDAAADIAAKFGFADEP